MNKKELIKLLFEKNVNYLTEINLGGLSLELDHINVIDMVDFDNTVGVVKYTVICKCEFNHNDGLNYKVTFSLPIYNKPSDTERDLDERMGNGLFRLLGLLLTAVGSPEKVVTHSNDYETPAINTVMTEEHDIRE